MPKRIILMYISEVSGHHSATMAIEKAIKIIEPGAEVMNLNAFNYTNPVSEKVINSIYMSVIKRAPKIWNYLYDNQKIVARLESIKKNVNKFNSPKLKKLFDQFKPDVIICTQAYPCGLVADFKKTYNSSIPLIAVLTDYVPHSYWIYEGVDYYITPSEDVSMRLQNKGVLPEKIKALGIPFDPKFLDRVNRENVLRNLRLDPQKKTVLIMGGGQGLGPIKTIVKTLDKLNYDIQEIVVTGTNKRLYKSLKRKVKKYRKKISVLGYVDNISELMSTSDIIISKPGGVTTAEVLAKKLPMIIVKPIPGQEENNATYLTGKKAAIKLDDPKKISSVLDELLSSSDKITNLRNAADKIAKPYASMDIAKLVLGLPYA